jgi:hypothetical protein
VSSSPHPGELASYAQLEPPILLYRVTEVASPAINPRLQRLITDVELIDAAWRQTWTVRNATEQEIAEYDLANQPPPDWPGFQAELLQSATFAAARIEARQIVESELPTAEGLRLERLLRASTALSAMDAAVLGAATDHKPFIKAWINLRQASLVSPEVAIGMAQIATAYHLPGDLIRALGAPEQ